MNTNIETNPDVKTIEALLNKHYKRTGVYCAFERVKKELQSLQEYKNSVMGKKYAIIEILEKIRTFKTILTIQQEGFFNSSV